MPRALWESEGGGSFLMSEVPLYREPRCGFNTKHQSTKARCLSDGSGYPSKALRAIRKGAGLFCGSLLRKGEVFAYVGLIQNLKDLEARRT